MAVLAMPSLGASGRKSSPRPTGKPAASAKSRGPLTPIETFFGRAAGERFGASVGLQHEGLLIGANRASNDALAQGAVDVFRKHNLSSGALWDGDNVNQQSDGRYLHDTVEMPSQDNAYLGWSMDVDADTAVVGMRGFDTPTDAAPLHYDDGGALILERSGNEWRLVQDIILMDTDGAFIDEQLQEDLEDLGLTGSDLTTSGWQFGHDVAIHGDLVAIGAPYASVPDGPGQDPHSEAGLVLIFNRSSGQWAYEALLHRGNTGSDELPRNFDYFGHSVALYNDLLVIGVPNGEPMDADLNDNNGYAYIFHRGSNGHWNHVETLRPESDLEWWNCGRFGWSVDISGTSVAVGQPGAGNLSDCPPQLPYHSGQGRAWVFEPDVLNPWVWANETVLWVEDPWIGHPWIDVQPALGAQYGWAVAITPCHVAVGAPGGDDDLLTIGGTYLWTHVGVGIWNFEDVDDFFESPIGQPADQWGHAVSINAQYLAMGAWRCDDAFVDGGAAELWAIGCDCNGNGISDDADIAADPTLDCDENGYIDSCEIAWDPSKDAGGQANGAAPCEPDGVLDACQVAPPGSLEWDPAIGGNGHRYDVIETPDTFTAAVALVDAMDAGADLASLSTWDEASFVATYLGWDISSNLWLGGEQDANAFTTTSGWSWRIGDAWSWARWDDASTNQPDTAGSPQTGLRAVSPSGSGAVWDWDDDDPDGDLLGWLIEYNRDCDGDGRLDEVTICEDPSQDCDDDGRIDSCMIDEGIVPDCNGSGTPDSCDIAWGFSGDCNSNDRPDECDIADGTSADCNANGLPDECDIANGTSDDTNGSGVPDECEFLRINEVLLDPADDHNGDGLIDDNDQYVEIVNFTDAAVDLTGGLILNDGSTWHVFTGTVLDPGCVILVFTDAAGTASYPPAIAASASVGDPLATPGPGLTRTITLFESVGGGYQWADDVTFGNEVVDNDGVSLTRCADLVGGWELHNDDESPCYTGQSNRFSPGRMIDGTVFPGDCAEDADGDGILDIFDNCDLFNPDQADCNGNGIGDVCDIRDHVDAGGLHEDLDCNWNWQLDVCEFIEYDCNDNGVPDACEVNDGTAEDCNANGLLDQCELDSGYSPDCNGNDIPDECDINSGVSEDCNDNGVPDECDLLDPSQDTNGNGVLDACECISPCDVNGDGLCTVDDFLLILQDQGCVAPPACPGDFNGDGFTDVNDILGYFAAGC